jgi:PAS domain S-box-containing protein
MARRFSWSSLPLRYKTRAGALISIVAILANILLLFVTRHERIALISGAIPTRAVITEIWKTDAAIESAEISVLGNALDLKDQDRREAEAEFQAVLQHVSTLGVLVSGNPVQKQRIDRLNQQVWRWVVILKQTHDELERGGSRERVKELLSRAAAPKAAIVQITAEMLADEDRSLLENRSALNGATRRVFWMCVSLLLIALCAGLWFSNLISRTIVSRLAIMRDCISALESGKPLPPVEPSGDEIGEIGSALFRTAGLLRDRTRALENALEGIATLDLKGRYVSANAAYAAMTGRTSEELIGQSWEVTVAPESIPDVVAAIAHMSLGFRTTAEFTGIRKDGSRFPKRVTLIPSLGPDGNRSGQYCFAEDLTDARAAEQIKEAHEVASAASQAKNQFLARMSHEIRTPMNVIVGVADLLSETSLDSGQRKYVEIFQSSSNHLLALITDILDIPKIETGRLITESVDFNPHEAIRGAMALMEGIAAEKGLYVKVAIAPGTPEQAVGDARKIQQILVNLLSNAFKFTAKGGVEVTASWDGFSETDQEPARETGTLRIDITDTGPGIAPEHLEGIFDWFTQGDVSITRKHSGTGLGLAISRRLTGAMGGTLEVSSELGAGTCFSLFLPLRRPGVLEIVPPRQPEQNALAGVRVLVVDKDATSRLVIDGVMRKWHCHVTESRGAVEAVVLLMQAVEKKDAFQVVLLDERLSAISGLDIAKRIRRQEWAKTLPMIILTSEPAREEAGDIRSLGLCGYMVKPVRGEHLRAALLAALDSDSVGPEEPAGEAASVDPHVKRILIADDNVITLLLVKEFLRDIPNLELDTAGDGEVALRLARVKSYDLIIMDLQMPVMDGLTATRRIREWESQQQVSHAPIVAFTANSLESELREALDAGCDAYLTKPVSKQEVIDTVLKFFSLRRAVEGLLRFQVRPDERFHEITQQYLTLLQSDLDHALTAAAAGDYEGVYEVGHRFVGSSATLGFPEVADTGRLLEQAARACDQGQILTQLRHLETYLSRLSLRDADG